MDTAIFFDYSDLREKILPRCTFESNTMMKAAFDFLFKKIDPKSYSILGSTPWDFFSNHFTTLFYEVDPKLALSLFLFLQSFGSSSMRGTFVDRQDLPVNRDFPLCRTQ